MLGLLLAVSVLLVTAGAGAGVVWLRLQGNITAKSVKDLVNLHNDSPTRATVGGDGSAEVTDTSALNILVMGSDTRKGNAAEGKDIYGAPRSDTTILIHLAEGRTSAVGVSIPRDSIVDLPDCQREDGTTVEARPHTMFNEAFGDGPGCTIRAVEQLTDIAIDHYVVVDFRGFKGMVNALGGVQVCVAEPIHDVKAKLDLAAGTHTIKGSQALGFVRSRHGVGDGSDLGRIDRQQTFLTSMIQKATSAGTLANPIRLLKFLDAATKSLTTDPGLADLNTMRKLAQSVQAMKSSNITFLTIPNEAYPLDADRVQWRQPAAAAVWSAIRNDEPVPGTRAYRAAVKASPKPSEALLRTRPAAVRVRVVNSAGVPGLATRTADELRAQGFSVSAVATGAVTAKSSVRHSAGYDESARTLEAAAVGASDVVDSSLAGTVQLVLGKDFGGLSVITDDRFADASPATTEPLKERTADENICS